MGEGVLRAWVMYDTTLHTVDQGKSNGIIALALQNGLVKFYEISSLKHSICHHQRGELTTALEWCEGFWFLGDISGCVEVFQIH